MQVIINADDLGYSPTINQVIWALMDSRRITSATLIVNAPSFNETVDQSENFPACSFGIHLNLTEFSALTKQQAFNDAGIIDEKGIFVGNMRQVSPTIALVDAVEKEWTAQITFALDHHIPISHLDSHHHVHTMPWLFFALKNIQRKFRIRKVRTTKNWYCQTECAPSKAVLVAKDVWIWSLRHLYTTQTTNYFTSLDGFLKDMEYGKTQPQGTVELMCHPGHPRYPHDFGLLQSDWQDQMPVKVDLISYNDLF